MNIVSPLYQVGRVRAKLSFRLHGRHLAVVLLKYTILVSLPNRRSEFAMTSSASATARTPRSLVSHLFGMPLRCRAVVPLQATISLFQTNPNPGIHISRCGQQNDADCHNASESQRGSNCNRRHHYYGNHFHYGPINRSTIPVVSFAFGAAKYRELVTSNDHEYAPRPRAPIIPSTEVWV